MLGFVDCATFIQLGQQIETLLIIEYLFEGASRPFELAWLSVTGFSSQDQLGCYSKPFTSFNSFNTFTLHIL